MKTSTWIAGALVAGGVLAAAGFGLYRLGQSSAMAPTGSTVAAAPGAALKAGDIDPANGRRILYYHDPMVPGTKFDKPGKSPFMDMMLVPVYAGGDGDEGKVVVSPRMQQNLGLRTVAVEEGALSPQVSAVGSIAYNERDQAVVQARSAGYVERLHVRATLDPVRKGQPLADLYVPDWVAAQEEFLSVRRMQGSDLSPLIEGARQRMRQAGMSDEQIRLVETTGRTHPRITLTAPLGGVVVELAAREGMTVMPGAMLFRINGLGTVWAQAEVPESQAALLRPGAKVQAVSPALPGQRFDGRVQALLPEVNAATRTLKARVELGNPGGRLVPGMFVSMQFMDMRPEKALLVPSDAVIQTGRRAVVMVAEDNGRFRPAEVEVGLESGGRTEIRRGLKAGQRVVISSQFLIDSEASLRGLEARLNDEPAPQQPAAAPRHEASGKVEEIGNDELTLSHEAIPALKWPAMTMPFKRPPQGLPRGLAVGDMVRFEFYVAEDGSAQLTRVSPVAPAQAHASGSTR